MRIIFPISSKLYLALLFLTCFALISNLFLFRWSFEREFTDYITAVEKVRLLKKSHKISETYIYHDKSWSNINTYLLRHQLGYSMPVIFTKNASDVPHSKSVKDKVWLPLYNEKLLYTAISSDNFIDQGLTYQFPVTLYDSNNNKVAGVDMTEASDNIVSVDILVSGEVVGQLKSNPRKRLTSSIENEYFNHQYLTNIIMGIYSLLFSIIISLILVKILLAPIRKLIKGIDQLSKGDYSEPFSEKRADEFGVLMRNISHLARRLRKNKDNRERLFADISHELRTPISVLTADLELLRDGIRPFGHDQLVSLEQETARLRHLTEDLYQLSLSNIDGLHYEFSKIDLTRCVADNIASYQQSVQKHGIELIFHNKSSSFINGDAKRVSQLLSNLIRNSITYTEAPGRVELDISTSIENFTLTISDSAPGATTEECELLFNPLYRQETSRSQNNSGAGLGLSICRNIVTAHNGTITAVPSTRLGGIEIVITLPKYNQDL